MLDHLNTRQYDGFGVSGPRLVWGLLVLKFLSILNHGPSTSGRVIRIGQEEISCRSNIFYMSQDFCRIKENIRKPFNVNNPVGRKRTHTLVAKSRGRSSRCCGLSSVVYHGWEGKKGATVIGASCCGALPA